MKTSILIAAAMAAILAAPAQAQPPAAYRVVVKLGDLDLAHPAHAKVAVSRLRKAAGDACRGGPAVSSDLIARTQGFQQCRRAALASAVDRLDAPQVREAYAGRRTGPIHLARR